MVDVGNFVRRLGAKFRSPMSYSLFCLPPVTAPPNWSNWSGNRKMIDAATNAVHDGLAVVHEQLMNAPKFFLPAQQAFTMIGL